MNNYQTIPEKVINNDTNMHELLSASFQGVKRLFVLAYLLLQIMMKHVYKTIESIFFQEQKYKIITYWLMEEISMINQLMI